MQNLSESEDIPGFQVKLPEPPKQKRVVIDDLSTEQADALLDALAQMGNAITIGGLKAKVEEASS